MRPVLEVNTRLTGAQSSPSCSFDCTSSLCNIRMSTKIEQHCCYTTMAMKEHKAPSYSRLVCASSTPQSTSMCTGQPGGVVSMSPSFGHEHHLWLDKPDGKMHLDVCMELCDLKFNQRGLGLSMVMHSFAAAGHTAVVALPAVHAPRHFAASVCCSVSPGRLGGFKHCLVQLFCSSQQLG